MLGFGCCPLIILRRRFQYTRQSVKRDESGLSEDVTPRGVSLPVTDAVEFFTKQADKLKHSLRLRRQVPPHERRQKLLHSHRAGNFSAAPQFLVFRPAVVFCDNLGQKMHRRARIPYPAQETQHLPPSFIFVIAQICLSFRPRIDQPVDEFAAPVIGIRAFKRVRNVTNSAFDAAAGKIFQCFLSRPENQRGAAIGAFNRNAFVTGRLVYPLLIRFHVVQGAAREQLGFQQRHGSESRAHPVRRCPSVQPMPIVVNLEHFNVVIEVAVMLPVVVSV